MGAAQARACREDSPARHLTGCWCVRRSLDDLTMMKGACPGNCSFPGSLPSGAIQSSKPRKSNSSAVTQVNPVWPPLRSGSGQPANDGEASIDREATSCDGPGTTDDGLAFLGRRLLREYGGLDETRVRRYIPEQEQQDERQDKLNLEAPAGRSPRDRPLWRGLPNTTAYGRG
jgi:hypothetical protein